MCHENLLKGSILSSNEENRSCFSYEDIKKCKGCEDYPTVKCEHIWSNGKKVWHCTVYCDKMCDNKISVESPGFIEVVIDAINKWNIKN